MRSIAIAIACVVAACGGGGGGGVVGKAKPVGPAIDEKTAEKDARGLATEVIDMLGRGNKDSLMSLLDPAMFVFGPRRADAYNRTDALVELGKIKKLAVRAGKLQLVASSGGRSAWAVDTLTIDGQPHAVTAILVNTDDIWQIESALVAPTPTWFAIKSELAKDAVVPVGAVAKGKVDPNANGAVDRYRKGLIDQDMFADDLTAGGDVIVVGPAAGEITRGKKDIKSLWKKRLEAKTRAIASGDVVAQVTPDGQLAWVSSPITQVDEKGAPVPMRAFAVFEKSDDDWKLVVLHESVAFDAAGSGVAFTKTLPPAPKEDKVVAVEADDDKKITPKKGKKDLANEKPKKAKKDLDDEVKPKKGKKSVADEKPKKAKKNLDDDEKPKAKKAKKTKKRDADDDDDDEKPTKAKQAKKAKKAKKIKKNLDDDDEEDEKPKKTKKKFAKKTKKTKKHDVLDEDKPYERYPGKPKPKKVEVDDDDDKPKKPKRAKKPKIEEEEEEDEKPKPKKKKKKKKEVVEEDEDRIVVD